MHRYHPLRKVTFFVTISLLFLLLPALATPIFAQERVRVSVFGSEVFTRTTGKPKQEIRTFTAPKADTPFTLRVTNGDPPITSAIIQLNNKTIFTPDDFKAKVRTLARTVSLAPENTLLVELRSKPDAFIIIEIFGDFLPPAPPLINPIASPIPKATQTITGTAAPGGTVFISGGAQQTSGPCDAATGTFSIDVALNEGTNHLLAWVTDSLGLTSDKTPLAITVDTTAPQIAIVSPPDQSEHSEPIVTVTGTIDDNSATVTVNGVSAIVTNNTFTAAGIPLSEGENTITATAIDPVGNTASDRIGVTLYTKKDHDLAPYLIDTSGISTDAQSLKTTGTVHVTIANHGKDPVSDPFELILFEDRDNNSGFNPAADPILGCTTVSQSIPAGSTLTVSLNIMGELLFRGNPLYASVDATDQIRESDETNNIGASPPEGIDLTGSSIRIERSGCPESVTLTARLGNAGGIAVGAGVKMAFYAADASGHRQWIGTGLTTAPLAPGQCEDVTMAWEAPGPGIQTICAAADDTGGGSGLYGESDEANNRVATDFELCTTIVAGGANSVAGRVIDAVTGLPIAGAEVRLKIQDQDVLETMAQEKTTTEGYYLFEGLQGGIYIIEAEHPGFIPGSRQVILDVEQSLADQHIVLCPVLADGEIRIVLTWGETPADLEAHLTGPNPQGCRYHCYFWEKTFPGAQLDRDDQNGDGPETITITQQAPGIYRYNVHDWTNRLDRQSTGLSDSGAEVRVYTSHTEAPQTFTVPAEPGTLWHVFDLDAHTGQIVAVNTMTSQDDAGEIDFPVITSQPVTTAYIGVPYTYPVKAVDPDHDTLRYILEQAPGGMTIDPATGMIRWTPTQDHLSTMHKIQVRVFDGQCGTDMQRFDIQIRSLMIRAYPEKIYAGQPCTLSWTCDPAYTCAIEPGIGPVAPSGSLAVSPADDTTYTITGIGPAETLTASATVIVAPEVQIASDRLCDWTPGDRIPLTWSVKGAETCLINQGIGEVASEGSIEVFPTEPTRYTLTAYSPSGIAMDAVEVPQIEDCSHPFPFSASSPEILPRESITLSWDSPCPHDRIEIYEDVNDNIRLIGTGDRTGHITVSPAQTTGYTAVRYRPGGRCGSQKTMVIVHTSPLVHLSASARTFYPGQPVTLTWTTRYAEACAIDPGIGPVPANGSIAVYPTEPTTYTLTASGLGSMARDSVFVAPANPVVTLSVAPSILKTETPATLRWTTYHAETCIIEPDIGAVPLNGSIEVYPPETTTYTLTATGTGGTTTSRATVFYAKPTVSITADTRVIVPGELTTLHWVSGLADDGIIHPHIGNVDPNGSLEVAPTAPTTYTITAYGPGGTATADVTVSLLTVALKAFPAHISSGQESTLTWTSANADTCIIEPGIGEVPASGSITVAPAENTTYTITASGFDRTVTHSATVALRIADDIDIRPIAIETHTSTDSQTLAISGYVDVRMGKTGTAGELEPFQVIVFEDRDHNGIFDPGTDGILGSKTVAQWDEGSQRGYSIPVNGTVLFADNRLYALVDAHDVLNERDEANNMMHTGINTSDTIDLTSAFIRADPSQCPAAIVLTARIGNGGNQIAPSGVHTTFYDGSPEDGGSRIGTISTTEALPPGAFQDLSLTWRAPTPGIHTIYVRADDDGTGAGSHIEADPINNLARAYLAICSPDLGDDPGSIAGQILDAQTKAPLEGTVIFLRAIENGGAGTVLNMTTSGADGTYRFVSIPPSAYVVEGSLVGYRMKRWPVMLCTGEPLMGQDLRLLPHLSVIITRPADESDVGVSPITVTGTVSHPTDTVVVNGVPAVVTNHTFTAQGIDLTDGQNTITAFAWDVDGNMAEKSISVTFDPTPLAVHITDPSDGVTVSGASIPVRFSVSSPSAKVTINGVPSDPWDDAVYHVPIAEGANTLTATATDPSGRTATYCITVYGGPDLPPALTLVHPWEQSVYESPITVLGAIADETATIMVNGVTAIVANQTFTAEIPLAAGANTITATATDTDGKTASDSITVTYHTGPPTCEILWPERDFIEYNSSCYLDVRSSLGTILVNGETERYGDWVDGYYYATFRVDLAEGPNVITAIASDSSGNTAQVRITGFYAGEDWPWVRITSPGRGETINTDRVDVIGTVEGTATFVTVNDTPATVTNGAFMAKDIALAQGYNHITVTATGPYNAVETATIRVYCDDTTPPVVTIDSLQDGSQVPSSPITVTGTMDDPNVTVTVNGVSATVANHTFTAANIYLTPGINTITVTARDQQGNIGQTSITVTCTKRVHIAITSPSDGATINRAEVMVQGTYAAEGVVILVNETAALCLDDGSFIANAVPLESGENTLTATITDSDGHTDAYPITVYADERIEDVRLTSNMQSGVPPLEITFTVAYDYNDYIGAKIVQAEIDFDSDGVIDLNPTSTTLSHTYETPGVYYPTITLTDALGNRYTGRTAIVVYDRDTMDVLLKSKWNGMKQALMDGDVEGALEYFCESSKERYRDIFTHLSDSLSTLAANMQEIELNYIKDGVAKYSILRNQAIEGEEMTVVYDIYFIQNVDGIWRIQSF